MRRKKTPRIRQIEEARGQELGDLLVTLLYDQGLSRSRAALALGVRRDTVVHWCKVYQVGEALFSRAAESYLAYTQATEAPVDLEEFLRLYDPRSRTRVGGRGPLHWCLQEYGKTAEVNSDRARGIEQRYDSTLAELLERMYCREGQSTIDIGEAWDVHPAVVAGWVRKLGLQRSSGETRLIKGGGRRASVAELQDLYVGELKSAVVIAREYGCSEGAVFLWLDQAGIERRSASATRLAKRDTRRPTEEELRQLYEVDRLSQKAIARRLRVAPITVKRWLTAAGIQRRDLSAAVAQRNGFTKPGPEELHCLHVTEGLGVGVMGERLGVSRQTVRAWLEKAGVRRPAKGVPVYSEEDGAEAYLRYTGWGDVAKVVSIMEFFSCYDPDTLQPSRDRPLRHLMQQS